jgi:hypothetical protein
MIVVDSRPDPRFTRISRKSELTDIANKVARLVYGKTFGDCLGEPQNVLKRQLVDKRIRVYIGEHPSDSATVTYMSRYNGIIQVPVCRLLGQIHSMVRHAKQSDVDICIVT